MEVSLTLAGRPMTEKRRWSIPINLLFTNTGEAPFQLDKHIACAGGVIGANVFEVTVDGNEVAYKGAPRKRRHPGPDSIVQVVPGETHGETVDIGLAYEIPFKGGLVLVSFRHSNDFSVDAVNLRSPFLELN